MASRLNQGGGFPQPNVGAASFGTQAMSGTAWAVEAQRDVDSLKQKIDQANAAQANWARTAAGWKNIMSGAFAATSREAALYGREVAKLAQAQHWTNMKEQVGTFNAYLNLTSDRLQGVGRVGAIAFGTLTGVVGGFARAGFAATAEAQHLGISLRYIGLETASLFTPQIHAALQKVREFASYLRSMSGEQQATIRHWITWGTAISGVAALLPRILPLMASVGLARRVALPAVAGALGGAGGAAGAAGSALALNPFGMAAVGIVGLLSASKEGREALASMATAVGRVVNALSGAFLPALEGLSEAIGKVINFILSKAPAVGTMAVGAAAGGAMFGLPGALFGAGMGALFELGKKIAGPSLAEQASGKSTELLKLQIENLKKYANLPLVKGQIEELEKVLKDRERVKESLTPASTGQTEDVMALYSRLQAAVIKDPVVKATEDNTDAVKEHTREMLKIARRLMGPGKEFD